DGDGQLDGDDPTPSGPAPNGGPISTGNDLEPNDIFLDATALENIGLEFMTFEGRIDVFGDTDVFDLGPLAPGDRITIDWRGRETLLTPFAAVFDGAGILFSATRRALHADSNVFGFVDEVIRHGSDNYYFAVAHEMEEPSLGGYRFDVTIERDGNAPTTAGQVFFLDFDGGTLTTPLLGVSTVSPFDAANISRLYEGQTDEMKQAIVDRFVEDFAGFDVVTITSDEMESPAAGEFSTILFGSFHDTVFGVSLGLDAYNVDQCDDGIIFTDSFQPRVFGFAPSAVAVGVAIGNVAAHEAGHLMGLYHVTDPTALMDERSPAIHLLTDQVFKTAVLSDSVFPLGDQDALLLLSETVGELP
ncbi:MAG: matrixin family metalloprotease, partial [Planctomycetes bacterium]|nr:matrixin family metalloprotease [Planctomycetota bacterium]